MVFRVDHGVAGGRQPVNIVLIFEQWMHASWNGLDVPIVVRLAPFDLRFPLLSTRRCEDKRVSCKLKIDLDYYDYRYAMKSATYTERV